MDNLNLAYTYLYSASLVLLGVGMLFALIRGIKGSSLVDRIIGINMVCNMTILAIAVLSLLMKESFILDVCLIYVMLSFLAVVVLCKVFITVYIKKKAKEGDRK